MYILGLSFGYHDSSAALIKDGEIIFASQEERFSRIKHDNSFPTQSILEAFKFEKINIENISFVIYYEEPLDKFNRIIKSILKNLLKNFYKGIAEYYNEVYNWINYNKFNYKDIISDKLNIDKKKIKNCYHHISHASSAFYNSNFIKASIITIDGVGENETITYSYGNQNKITKLKSFSFPNSLGLFYSTITAFLGFEVNEGEYKVMGMAAYGEPKFTEKVKKTISFSNNKLKLNKKYFNFDDTDKPPYTDNFINLFGSPRNPDSEINKNPLSNEFIYYSDLAASFQFILEQIVFEMIDEIFDLTKNKNLCMSGGVALNAVLNGKILKKKTNNLYVFPASGDSGTSVGAAQHYYYSELNHKRKLHNSNILLGQKYDDNEVLKTIEKFGIKNYKRYDDFSQMTSDLSKILQDDKVIGFFQGRSEFGPRALGSRSIIASPVNSKMRDIINEKIKFREIFRPFAPIVLAEHAKKYFDINNIENFYQPENFMISVSNVLKNKSNLFPSAISIDNSARVQIIWEDYQNNLRMMLEKFYIDTGLPILINTSFNRKGEPIVEKPEDAFKVFLYTDLDYLVINNFIINK